MCHPIGGVGAELGPALDGWGRGKSADVIATAIVDPSADIAHGYDGTELRDQGRADDPGRAIKQGDPLMVRSMGGVTQIIPADRVGSRRRMPRSLMMSAAQLGLTAQDVADLVAFLSGSPETQVTGRPPRLRTPVALLFRSPVIFLDPIYQVIDNRLVMESTRQELLRNATATVRRAGSAALNFRDLGHSVGVKSSTVHYYFPTKSDLLNEAAADTPRRSSPH